MKPQKIGINDFKMDDKPKKRLPSYRRVTNPTMYASSTRINPKNLFEAEILCITIIKISLTSIKHDITS